MMTEQRRVAVILRPNGRGVHFWGRLTIPAGRGKIPPGRDADHPALLRGIVVARDTNNRERQRAMALFGPQSHLR